MHRANESLLESADGSMATAANSAGRKNIVQRKSKRIHLTRPAFSWKAITRFDPEVGMMSAIAMFRQLNTPPLAYNRIPFHEIARHGAEGAISAIPECAPKAQVSLFRCFFLLVYSLRRRARAAGEVRVAGVDRAQRLRSHTVESFVEDRLSAAQRNSA